MPDLLFPNYYENGPCANCGRAKGEHTVDLMGSIDALINDGPYKCPAPFKGTFTRATIPQNFPPDPERFG